MVRVDGREIEWHEGMTIADLLRELDDPFPYPLARIDGRVVTAQDFDNVPLPDNVEVFLVSLVAGG
jgi:thiamine biosynthesis protein ThiS